MTALRHNKSNALAIVRDSKVDDFLSAGYHIVQGQDNNPAPDAKPKRRRKKKVSEDAANVDGSM